MTNIIRVCLCLSYGVYPALASTSAAAVGETARQRRVVARMSGRQIVYQAVDIDGVVINRRPRITRDDAIVA